MKKNLFLIIIVSFLFYLTVIDNKNNNTSYSLKEEANLTNFIIKDNLIYYLTNNNINSTLYKTNLNLTNHEKITELAGYCFLEDNFIVCNNNSYIKIYNLELTNIYKSKVKNGEYITPYKDTFLKINNNNLYLNDTLFTNINLIGTYKNYFYNTYNTYLLFINYDTKISYLYDINNKTIKEINYSNYFKYNKGFCFYNADNLYIIDLIDNKEYTLKNPLNIDLYLDGNIYFPSIYLYNSKSFINYNYDTNKTYNISLPTLNINNILVKDNFLYYSYINSIYKIDLTNNIDKDTEVLNNTKNIEDKYHIKLYIKDKSNLDYKEFNIDYEDDNDTINNALNKIDNIMSKFPEGFFKTFYDDTYKGLHIYLTGKITPKNLDKQVENPTAYSLTYDAKYIIVIDITKNDLETTLAHEIFHNIEFKLQDKNIFLNWNKYNPQNFTYNYSYTKPYKYDYTLNEEDNNNVYFIDKYSETYPEEDRARIFEVICNSNNNLSLYPHLYQKALYLKTEILKYYPNFSEIFKIAE